MRSMKLQMKHLKLLILISPLIVSQESGYAQETHTLYGKVIHGNTGKPLQAVNIQAGIEDRGTITGENGEFTLSGLIEGEQLIRFTHIGFEMVEKTVFIPSSHSLEITLNQNLIEMDALVVTGTRTERYLKDAPVTTQVIKGEKLKESGASDISDVISEMTGINIVENQFGTGVELLGFDTDHILVMVDGMKLIGRVNGQLDVAQIPVDHIDRIEVVKGATSALYGSEAMGGVINILTKQPGQNRILNSDTSFGAYGRIKGALSFGNQIKGWNYFLSGGYRHFGGYDIDPSSVWEDGSEYNKANGQFKLRKNWGKGLDFNLDALILNERQNLVSSSVFQDKIVNDRISSRVELRKTIGYWQLKGIGDYAVYDHQFDRLVLSSGILKKGSITTDTRKTASIVVARDSGRHSLNGGFGREWEGILSDRVKNAERNSILTNLFLQDEYTLTHKWTLLTGMRLDMHSIYGQHISPKISIMYKPEMISRIRVAYGEGFRAPSFKELFLDYSNISVGYHIVGNEQLHPETSRNFNVDIERWHTRKYHGRLNLFWNEIEGLIDYKYLGMVDGYGTYTSENLTSARTAGFEMDYTYFITQNLEAWIGMAYLDSWDEERESALTFKSRYKGNGGIRLTMKNNIKFNMRIQYTGKRFYWNDIQEGAEPEKSWIDGYTLINGHMSFPMPLGLRGYAGGKNLTDYVDNVWGPMPGREWYIGLKYDLTNQQN